MMNRYGDIMNKVFEYKTMWLHWFLRTGLIGLIGLMTPAHAQLMLAHEGHHSGDCAIKTGNFPVAFSAYEKPKGALPPTHAYCDHVPNTGEMICPVDLKDGTTREIPIALRLIMEGHGDGHAIISEPAKLYPSGSITLAANLQELGQYNLLLETEKDGKLITAVSIPIHVGGGGGHDGHGGSGIGLTEILLLLGVGSAAAFFWWRRRTNAT